MYSISEKLNNSYVQLSKKETTVLGYFVRARKNRLIRVTIWIKGDQMLIITKPKCFQRIVIINTYE